MVYLLNLVLSSLKDKDLKSIKFDDLKVDKNSLEIFDKDNEILKCTKSKKEYFINLKAVSIVEFVKISEKKHALTGYADILQ